MYNVHRGLECVWLYTYVVCKIMRSVCVHNALDTLLTHYSSPYHIHVVHDNLVHDNT